MIWSNIFTPKYSLFEFCLLQNKEIIAKYVLFGQVTERLVRSKAPFFTYLLCAAPLDHQLHKPRICPRLVAGNYLYVDYFSKWLMVHYITVGVIYEVE